jgi:signal peptidase
MTLPKELEKIKKIFFSFWRSEDEKISFIRDILVAVFVVLVILTVLWGYTGQWFGAPMVAIESGSMMHENEPFGRIGTIDAGDMVLLVKVSNGDDILTRGSDFGGEKAKESDGYFSYGDYGDVIVYRKYGIDEEDQIIHRAMCWIEKNEDDTYTIEEWGIYNEDSITIPELGLSKYKPDHSGYITKGDNPITNDRCDQAGGICSDPIKLEWITGKARGELPWVGTVNLLFNDIMSGAFFNDNIRPTIHNVPNDCIISLVILIIVLISIPVIIDVFEFYKKKREFNK